jgi:hypothetical protein
MQAAVNKEAVRMRPMFPGLGVQRFHKNPQRPEATRGAEEGMRQEDDVTG